MFHRLPQLDLAGRKLSCAPFSQEIGYTKFFVFSGLGLILRDLYTRKELTLSRWILPLDRRER